MGSWKELNQSLAGMKRKTVAESNEAETASNYDPYDMLVKSLGFEKKEARGGERLKTDDEKIKDEKERLEKLEEDRLRRMRGEKPIGKTHVSVEDLGDEEVKKKNKLTAKEKRKLMKQLLNDHNGTESGDEKDGNESENDEDEEQEDEEEESDEEEDDDDEDEDEE